MPCTSPRAYYKVTHVYHSSDDDSCQHSGDGLDEWPNSGPGRSDVTLCVERQFRPGQCFLAKGDTVPTSSYPVKGRDCGGLYNDDKPYNFLLEITAVKPGSDTIDDCPTQYPGQPRYTTRVLDDTKLLCLKVAFHGTY